MDEAGELCPLICFSMFKGHSIRYVVISVHYTMVFHSSKYSWVHFSFLLYCIILQPIVVVVLESPVRYVTLTYNFIKKET